MSVFTKYKTITCPRSQRKIKAPAEVVDTVYKAGYYISTGSSGKYAAVYEYDRNTKKSHYVASLAYFISDRIAGYKDGNGCNLTKSNLIMLKD